MNRLTNSLMTNGILSLVISFIIAVWVFVYSQVNYEQREAAEAAIRTNTQRVMAFEQYVVRTLEEVDLVTTYVADRYASEFQKRSSNFAAINSIDQTALRLPSIREINVFNRFGDLVASSAKPLARPANIFNTDIFQEHLSLQSTALQVHPPQPAQSYPGSLLLMSRRVNMSDGSFGGTVNVKVRPNVLTDFLQNASLPDTDLVSVIGLDGITRARREGNVLSFGQNVRGRLVMQMQQKAPYGNYLGPSSLDGLVRYFSHRRLPQYGLFVTSGVSQTDVLRPVQARAKAYVLGGTIITLVTIIAAMLMFMITKRRIVYESEMLATNERLQQAQQLAKLGDWKFDIYKEEFILSDDLCKMYGRSNDDNVISLHDYTTIIGQHGIQIFRDALKHCEAFGGRQEFELAARLPSGTFSYRRIVCVADYDASQNFVGIHGTDQDITPRKLLESLQKQVSELSKVDAMNTIAATLAHELNQPLTAASNYLSGSIRMMSAREDARNDVIIEALTAVRQQIYHSGEIIRRVRNLVGNRQSRIDPASLSDLIASGVKLFAVANPGFKVTIDPAPEFEDVMVLADPVQLQQILVNLLRNAQEACGSSPQIAISTKRGENNTINVCVIDNGSGIEDFQTDPFSSFTTSKGGSLGLGLAICRTLIESMGGAIWIDKTGSQGTTICFSVQEITADSNSESR